MSKSIEIKLYPFQNDILKALNKYNVVTVAIGRRLGKSYIGALASVLHCLKAPKDKPRRVLIVCPTIEMSRESYWSQLKEFLQIYRPYVKSVKEREKDITFTNDSVISLKSADRPDTLRGISGKATVSFIIMDEFSFLRDAQRLFEEVIQPYRANVGVNCKFMCISTPKGQNNFFHSMFMKGNDESIPDHTSLHYSCYEARPDLKDFFDDQKKLVSEKAFKQEYLANFIGSGNTAFYAFDRTVHIDHNIRDVQNGEQIVIGLDANFGIMAHLIARVKANPENRSYYIECIKEVHGKHKNVEQFCQSINKDYVIAKNNRVVVCPDASMSQRAYSASIGLTGMQQLREAGFEVRTEKRNPTFIDSVQVVNQFFMNADAKINMKIHPSCVTLISALESTQWAEQDGHKLDKTTYSKTGHILDCLRYLSYQYKTLNNVVYLKRTIQF